MPFFPVTNELLRRGQNTAVHDSIIAIGNGGTKPTTAALTLTFNQGTGSYEIDQLLQPDQQMWIDVGQLIRGQAPDKNGNILPAALAMGSCSILLGQSVPFHAHGNCTNPGRVDLIE